MLKSKDKTELDVLQREYRNMEINRRDFAEETTLILRKQNQTLEKLRKENETLKEDYVSLQARTTLKPISSFEQNQTDKLVMEIEKYQKMILSERSRMTSMEKQISSLRSEIWQQRRSMGGVHAASDNQRIVEKQVRILENRLDQALVRFNKSLAMNRKLRQEIDDLRCERASFESMYKKLEKNLQEKKKQMAHIIELSNLAYEQKDRAQLEILAIDQSNKKEQEQFDQQMLELGNVLENEIKAASQRRKLPPPGTTSQQDDLKAANERKIAHEAAILREKEMLARQQREQKLQNFEEAFRKIAAATGIHDIDELVKIFVANEEQNFSLFSYANEQANDIEKLRVQIHELKEEQSKYAQENGSNINEYDLILKETDEKINMAKTQAENYQKKAAENQRVFDKLKDGIKMLLARLEIDDDAIAAVSITETNVLYYLGLIEEKTNEILSRYQVCMAEENNLTSYPNAIHDEKGTLEGDLLSGTSFSQKTETTPNKKYLVPSILGLGPEIPMGGGEQIYVNPPRLADYSSDENSPDEGDGSCAFFRPFTRDELENKAVDRINQQRKQKMISKMGMNCNSKKLPSDGENGKSVRRNSSVFSVDPSRATGHSGRRQSILDNAHNAHR